MISGTTMERIVRATRVPVLLAKNDMSGPYEKMLGGVDLSGACEAVLSFGHRLVPEAAMTIFHAVHVPYGGRLAGQGDDPTKSSFYAEAQQALARWWGSADLPHNLEMPEPEVAGRSAALSAHLAAQMPDVLLIGAHTNATFSVSRLGSFAEEILRDPPFDVLVARDQP